MHDHFIFTIVCGAAALLLVTGCTRDIEKPPARPAVQKAGEQQAQPNNGTQGDNNAEKSGRKKRTLSLNDKEKREEQKNDSAGESLGEPLFQGRESLLHEDIQGRIMPEDFKIGKLQDDYDPDPDLKTILEKASLFFEALKDNKIEPLYLHPDWRKLITRSLASPGEGYTGFTRYRFGTIEADETRARMNIRLFSLSGRSEGEVFLEKEAGTWYISDVQIDLSKLLATYEPEGEFEPSTYRWLELY